MKRMIRSLRALAGVLCLLLPLELQAQELELLTNTEIVQLVAAGVGSQIVIDQIHASRGRYDLSTRAILDLSRANVGAEVIAAMRESNDRFGEPRKARAAFRPPTDFGVYLVRDDAPISLQTRTIDQQQRRDRQGRTTTYQVVSRPAMRTFEATTDDDVALILFLRDATKAASIRLVALNYRGDGQPAEVGDRVPVRTGTLEGTTDPRYVRVVPGGPLPVGMYALAHAEAPGLLFPFVRGEGALVVPTLDRERAATLARVQQAGAVHVTASEPTVRDAVRAVLAQERVTIQQDFDDDHLLITALTLKKCGLLSLCTRDLLVQYAVHVEPAGEGSALRVESLVYRSGLPGGDLNAAVLDLTPKALSPGDMAKVVEDLRKNVMKDLEKRAGRR
jgi:hypothetical protein